MRKKHSFVTNSSTTAYIMIGKKLTAEEFKAKVANKDFKHLNAVKHETEYGRYPFIEDGDKLEEIASEEHPEDSYGFFEYAGVNGSADWSPEYISLKDLKVEGNLEDYYIILYGTGGGC